MLYRVALGYPCHTHLRHLLVVIHQTNHVLALAMSNKQSHLGQDTQHPAHHPSPGSPAIAPLIHSHHQALTHLTHILILLAVPPTNPLLSPTSLVVPDPPPPLRAEAATAPPVFLLPQEPSLAEGGHARGAPSAGGSPHRPPRCPVYTNAVRHPC